MLREHRIKWSRVNLISRGRLFRRIIFLGDSLLGMILAVQGVACVSFKSVQQTQCEALATWEKLKNAQVDNESY